jgi:ribosomal protein S18 acetylase RimI-like enzyme
LQFGAHLRLDDVCVSPSRQRQGIAAALLRDAVHAADEERTPLYVRRYA